VRAASRLPGVLRIALIGSLTTDEPDPKDADLLVTVADDADLAPLATLGRKLQGHAQSFNRGGEVFLADPRGNYLGRTCPWKYSLRKRQAGATMEWNWPAGATTLRWIRR